MTEKRLSSLALLSIESDVLKQLEREKLIENFLAKKFRKGEKL